MPIPSGHTTHPASLTLVALTSWWFWEGKSALATCDTTLECVLLPSGLPSEMLLQNGVRAAE